QLQLRTGQLGPQRELPRGPGQPRVVDQLEPGLAADDEVTDVTREFLRGRGEYERPRLAGRVAGHGRRGGDGTHEVAPLSGRRGTGRQVHAGVVDPPDVPGQPAYQLPHRYPDIRIGRTRDPDRPTGVEADLRRRYLRQGERGHRPRAGGPRRGEGQPL